VGQWHHLYNTTLWRNIRKRQLEREPLCRYCLARGEVTPAVICDHKVPHRGDTERFYEPSNLQSLCKRCHDSDKQREERGKEPIQPVGLDGWPVNFPEG